MGKSTVIIRTMKIPREIIESPDKLYAYCVDNGIKITIRTMTEDNYVLIEGDADALVCLGHLLIAQAGFQKDCGFQFSPTGAGQALFNSKSDTGIYIHRLPCLENEGRKNRRKKRN